MRGSLTRRGKTSWRLKYDLEPDATGRRQIRYVTLRGTKAQAQEAATKILAEVATGTHVEPSKVTVTDFVRARVDQWEAAGTISARTAQRYRQLVEHQIVPYLGGKTVQKLQPLDLESWHTALRNNGRVRGHGGVSARTVGHVHRILGKALRDAVRNRLVSRNVASEEPAPKVDREEISIVRDVSALVTALRGWRLGTVALVALLTGARLSETLALRWSRVDLDKGVIQVRETLEQTKAHGLRLKPPKSKAGRRDITLPDILVDALRAYRKAQLELRMQLGAGKLPEDALVFATLEGEPLTPNSVSTAWIDFADKIGMPDVTFHALRHTHASQLIDAGVDIATISKRLGHAKPDITLRVYAHLFRKDDSRAADAINAALAGK
jgi:integrase